MDGAWLRHIANAGPMDDVKALLFTVWNDESGNGNPALHHGNLYTRLMEALGVHLPEIRSRAYANHPAFFESGFVQPVFELTMSLYSEELLPELIGMTLFLEWEVLYSCRRSSSAIIWGSIPNFFECTSVLTTLLRVTAHLLGRPWNGI